MIKEELIKNFKITGFIVIAAFFIVVILAILYPLAIIYALNVLFPMLSIPYNFFTWLATAFLHFCTFGYLHIKA